jgi:hypothetical protein
MTDWAVSGHIKVERRCAVLIVTMTCPEKKNAMTNAMYGAMSEAIEDRGNGRGGSHSADRREGRDVYGR